MKKTGPTNKNLVELIKQLKEISSKGNSKIWKRVASDLERPTRQRRIVNIAKLARFTKENEIVVVPGKVLGTGEMGHSLTVAAFNFSDSAKKQIESAKGKAVSIIEIAKQNPQGKKVRIMG